VSQIKKEKLGATQRESSLLNQIQGKSGQLSIGTDGRDLEINELLKLTEKSGVASTRHRNPDFLSKLENE